MGGGFCLDGCFGLSSLFLAIVLLNSQCLMTDGCRPGVCILYSVHDICTVLTSVMMSDVSSTSTVKYSSVLCMDVRRSGFVYDVRVNATTTVLYE